LTGRASIGGVAQVLRTESQRETDGDIAEFAKVGDRDGGQHCPILRPPMVRAELLGTHSHATSVGVTVHVWKRGEQFLARGRFEGHQFGRTLKGNAMAAASELRHLLVDIENGSFQRPSLARRRPLSLGPAPRLTVRELCDRFLKEKRHLLGKDTARNYQARLVPLIEFAEQRENLRRRPLAQDVDREFAVQFRTALFGRSVTRNGHISAIEKRISPRQVRNVLDAARSLFHWAKQPQNNLLPSTFLNPFTREIVGEKPRKDPLRPVPIPAVLRIELVDVMDQWQLCQFAIPLVLPLRPEDYTGLLLSEVDFDQRVLRFGTRMAGRDFNKGRQSFLMPFPPEITPLLRHCAGDRVAGPLLVRRAVWNGDSRPRLKASSPAEVEILFERAIQAARTGEIQADQDLKRLFRRLLLDLGGVSQDALAKEFKQLLSRLSPGVTARFYDLRASCTTELERSGVSHLVQRYVTGHTTSDIMYEYSSLDPSGQMQKYFDFIRPLLTAIEERRRALEVKLTA
jgi:hypothetical protein